jgi:hypothetical protein
VRYIGYALVGEMAGEPRTQHYWGLPPQMTGGNDIRTLMPRARVLIITDEESGIMLFRFSASGEFAGDTWHQNLDDAKHQATYEYGDALGEWQSVPEDTSTDPTEFILSLGL